MMAEVHISESSGLYWSELRTILARSQNHTGIRQEKFFHYVHFSAQVNKNRNLWHLEVLKISESSGLYCSELRTILAFNKKTFIGILKSRISFSSSLFIFTVVNRFRQREQLQGSVQAWPQHQHEDVVETRDKCHERRCCSTCWQKMKPAVPIRVCSLSFIWT